jgi:hypothetical protein
VRPEPLPARRVTGVKTDAAMGSAAAGIRWKGELAGIANAAAPEAEEPTIKEDITRAMPSWLVSLVVHLILLVLLALLAGPVGPNFGRVLLTMGQADGTSDTQLEEFAIEQDPTTDTELDEALSEEVVDVTLPPLDAVGAEFSEQTFAPVPVEVGLGEPAIPASPMVGGRSGAMKKTLMLLYGGTPITESAVASGLKWLAKNQTKDGSWSLRGPYDDGGTNENRPAATAMALLAFMGAGNTHVDGEYAKVVDRGARYLVKKQNRDGFFAVEARDHQQAYAQAQCSVAICELYAMTKDSWLRDPAQKAVKCAEEWQAEEGGWRYQPRFDSDTSVTGWFVMALQSALAGGLEVDRAVLYRVTDFLDTVQSYDGAGYSYQPRGAPSQAMTAEGLLCRQYLGWPRNHKALVRGVDALATDYIFNINEADYYYWYYATQVLHHYGGEPWNAWNNVMRVQLPDAQIKRGAEAGSWAPQSDRWGGTGGRLYTTCMAIYCLEVYYRHMPLYKADVDDKPQVGVDKAVD